MGKNNVMLSKDAVSASLAECFVTIGDRRYNFMQAINLEAKFDKEKSEIPILGKTGKGNKTTGWKGTGSATFHYNTSIFRKMMLDYKRSGRDTQFDIQITNEDPTSSAGRQTIILEDCNIDGGILAKFDADSEYLDEDMDFTFEDFSMPEKFKNLKGFLTNQKNAPCAQHGEKKKDDRILQIRYNFPYQLKGERELWKKQKNVDSVKQRYLKRQGYVRIVIGH